MADFTSALYLGFVHPKGRLPSFDRLTTGRPSALENPAEAENIAARLSTLMGCESAVLASSTLHVFTDLFKVLAREPIVLLADDRVYPVVRWGLERAAAMGVKTIDFKHHDPDDLERKLSSPGIEGLRPVAVTDGICTTTGNPAPLDRYLASVKARNGLLVVDDTQALGVLGRSPDAWSPYGKDGGGTACFKGVRGNELIVAASLAKGFGVPMAVLAGSRIVIHAYEERSETRVHCSPPSFACIAAASSALFTNIREGKALRKKLHQNVVLFRHTIERHGIPVGGGLFPVQTVTAGDETIEVYNELKRQNVGCLLLKSGTGEHGRLGFIMTAAHCPRDVEEAAGVLVNIMAQRNGFTKVRKGHFKILPGSMATENKRRIQHDKRIDQVQSRTF